MQRRIVRLFLVVAIVMAAASAQAALFDVYADANSSGGGSGLATIGLTSGQGFSVTVNPNDLWSAGALPRWSNADGLIKELKASGSDESGQPAGTLIGGIFGNHTQGNLTAPFGALVGRIDSGNFFLIGANYAGTASASGTLYLYYWDSNNADNSNYITANINAVPVPAAILLFGPGLAGLAAIRKRLEP